VRYQWGVAVQCTHGIVLLALFDEVDAVGHRGLHLLVRGVVDRLDTISVVHGCRSIEGSQVRPM
jgi:hypothetical protein